MTYFINGKFFSCINRFLIGTFFVFAAPLVSSDAGENASPTPSIKSGFKADYQVKASFFPLPIKAAIKVERQMDDIYLASVKVKSPFFKVDQREKARIVACNVELLELESEGDRVGARSWKEFVEVAWPEKVVSYRDGSDSLSEYPISLPPTGFVSFFAHQYTALQSGKSRMPLVYVQSKKGWRVDFESTGVDQKVDNRFYRKDIDAFRLLVPRENMKEADMPNVWYRPQDLGSFPLKMAMKLGVFRLEVNLKEIDGSKEEIQRFFQAWECPQP